MILGRTTVFDGRVRWIGRYETYQRLITFTRTISSGTRRRVVVLGIESSCDDSCASIVDSERKIWSNVRLNQNHVHRTFNGIHPYHAIQAHQVNIPIAIGQALKDAQLKLEDIDAIAYTRGPGIAGCLAVGATAAKTLSCVTGRPLLAVHHMQAHVLTPFLTQSINQNQDDQLRFPFLSLLVSGGHTLLVLVYSSCQFKILANTADKPLGALNVTWPEGSGSPGSALEEFVSEMGGVNGKDEGIDALPIALRTGPETFSFCGLQTATMRRIESIPNHHLLSNEESILQRRKIGFAFFTAAFAQIERKISHWITHLALVDNIHIHDLVISGGVGSNLLLRERIEKLLKSIDDSKIKLHVPPVSFCTDNAAMVAWTGIDKLSRGKISHLSLPVAAKWSLEDAENEGLGSI